MNKIEAKMGGSLVYVMILITFLGILSAGFLYMTESSRRAVMNNRAYIEARTAARSIHQSFCEAVSSNTSEAMDMLWACFEEDCEAAGGEYETAAGDGEPEEDLEGLLIEEDGGTAQLQWEAFLRDCLEEKAYVATGGEELPEQMSVRITLTAFPLKSKATVHTAVVYNRYHFSMNGDILFDNLEGSSLDLGRGFAICTEGGVCRYYGDE